MSLPSLLNYTITAREESIWKEMINSVPEEIDIELIQTHWANAKKHFQIYNRSLPKPIWKERSFEQRGKEVWNELTHKIPSKNSAEPMSIYIHIPFCDTRCDFCDCYSLQTNKGGKKLGDSYIDAVLKEMKAWTNKVNIDKRPITTIHFGGGTPNSINKLLLYKIIEQCVNCFNIEDKTELALESISSLLTNEHLWELREMGFSRLHVGVQTLDDSLRSLIGRRETSELVIDKLLNAINIGFIVTADIIAGFPKQTIEGFIRTLQQLIDIKIHGFSVYQLQISKLNKRFSRIANISKNRLHEYLLFHIAEHYLISKNYQKNHFDHYSKPEDKNYYSTHMSRGEDLLAIGATAYGMLDYYHYHHPKIKDYITCTDSVSPALDGGIWESGLERKIRPVKIDLMMGRINKSLLMELGADELLDFWQDCSLIRELSENEFILTANGSWFINDMINQVMRFSYMDS